MWPCVQVNGTRVDISCATCRLGPQKSLLPVIPLFLCRLDVAAQGKLATMCGRWQVLCERRSLDDYVEHMLWPLRF